MKLRFFAKMVLIINCLIMAGCATPKATRSGGDSNNGQLTSFWQPNLLYLLASPHPRLYVEVDAVEGCEPSETTLNKLRGFLATYCKKPGGIEIIRSDVIPIEDAQGKASRRLPINFSMVRRKKAATHHRLLFMCSFTMAPYATSPQ